MKYKHPNYNFSVNTHQHKVTYFGNTVSYNNRTKKTPLWDFYTSMACTITSHRTLTCRFHICSCWLVFELQKQLIKTEFSICWSELSRFLEKSWVKNFACKCILNKCFQIFVAIVSNFQTCHENAEWLMPSFFIIVFLVLLLWLLTRN